MDTRTRTLAAVQSMSTSGTGRLTWTLQVCRAHALFLRPLLCKLASMGCSCLLRCGCWFFCHQSMLCIGLVTLHGATAQLLMMLDLPQSSSSKLPPLSWSTHSHGLQAPTIACKLTTSNQCPLTPPGTRLPSGSIPSRLSVRCLRQRRKHRSRLT